MSERKKPSWMVWVTAALIGLPVLYVLSSGPAGTIHQSSWLPKQFDTALMEFYAPLDWVLRRCPASVRSIISEYRSVWYTPVN